jgi:hypothetical protein
MRGNDYEAADGGLGGAQDEHYGAEDITLQREQRAANAHLGQREQCQNYLAKLIAVAFDGEGPVQCESPSMIEGWSLPQILGVWIEICAFSPFSPLLQRGEGGRRPDEGSMADKIKPLFVNVISETIKQLRLHPPHPPVGTFSPPKRRGEGG